MIFDQPWLLSVDQDQKTFRLVYAVILCFNTYKLYYNSEIIEKSEKICIFFENRFLGAGSQCDCCYESIYQRQAWIATKYRDREHLRKVQHLRV